MEHKQNPLGYEPINKLLFRLAIPTITAQLINMLYNIVDRIYIGHMPNDGALALTGLGVTMPIIMIVSAFAALVSAGAAPRASVFMGKKDIDSAEATLGNSVTLLVLVAMVITPVIIIFGKDLLLLFGASQNTINFALDYLNIYAIGTIFVQLTLGLTAFVTAQGFAKEGMISVLIGAICNIVLDPIFIYMLNMGVKGAALATIISQGLSCLYVIKFLFGNKTKLKIKKKNLKLRNEIYIPSIKLGLSSFIMQSSESILNISFNASLLHYGGDLAVGAMTIMSSILQFALLPMNGLGQGAQPIISFNYGAKNVDRVKKTVKLLLTLCVSYSFTIWALIQLFPNLFISIFTKDPALMSFTHSALRIYIFGLFILGVQIACQLTFTALGYAKASILAAITRKFILLIPLIFILPRVLTSNPTNSIYLAEPIADILASIFTGLLFIQQFKFAIEEMNN